MLAHDPAQHRRSRGGARGESDAVFGAVQGSSDVVAHAAVDRYVGADDTAIKFYRLDRPDFVQGDARRSDDRAAGLERQRRLVDSRVGARSRHYPPDLRCHIRDVDRIVAVHVRDTHAAPEVEFGDADSLFLVQSLGETDDATRGHLEPGRVENLRADV